jgi:hypothetical protein
VQGWFFYTVDLEITNLCRQDCAFCPRQAISRGRGVMPAGMFERVAERLLLESAQVTLSGMGDPLLHPEWERFVRHYRGRGGEIGVQVSAASLNRRKVELLVEAAPSFINLSLPSLAPEILSQLLPGRDPAEIVELALLLVEKCRRHVPLSIIGLRTALEQSGEQAAFARFWRNRKVPVRVFDCHSRGGNLKDERLLGQRRPTGIDRPCGLFARHAFITCRGELLACCHDLNGETRLGDFARQELSELVARKAELAGRVPPFELCRRCDEPLRLLPLPEGPPPGNRRQRARYLRFLKSFSGRDEEVNKA